MNFSYVGIDTSRDEVQASIFEQDYNTASDNFIDLLSILSSTVEELDSLMCSYSTVEELRHLHDMMSNDHVHIFELEDIGGSWCSKTRKFNNMSNIVANYIAKDSKNKNKAKIITLLKKVQSLLKDLLDEAITIEDYNKASFTEARIYATEYPSAATSILLKEQLAAIF